MSNYLAIATVTAALRQRLVNAVGAETGVSDATVEVKRPDSTAGAGDGLPRINLYLYLVQPNPACRNNDLPTRRSDGTLAQRPRTALNLHYLLSFYGDENTYEPQRLLGCVIRAMQNQPVLSRDEITNAVATDKEHLDGSNLAEEFERVRFTPLPFSLEDWSKVWPVFFQTPYVLSVAYQAAVVLIESDETPQPALTVRRAMLKVTPFRQPVIERVAPADAQTRQITPGSAVVVHGHGLRGERMQVRIGAVTIDKFAMATDTQIKLTLPPGLRAGIQGLQVVHRVLLGEPESEPRGFESNIAAFVLSPVLRQVEYAAAALKVTINLPVGRKQRVVLLLNKLEPEPRLYRFTLPPREDGPDEAEIVNIPVTDVEQGKYLVRVQIDGAESPLQPDYSGPMVVIS